MSHTEPRFHIVGHHFTPTEAIINHVKERFSRLDLPQIDILDLHVTFSCERKTLYRVAVRYHAAHVDLFVEATSDDMYKSIDLAFDKLKRRVHRWKEKITDHHHASPQDEEAFVSLLDHVYDLEQDEIVQFNEEIEKKEQKALEAVYPKPAVVSREKKRIKTLSLQEALMKLDCMGAPFLLYRSEEDRKMKILYRRPDFKMALVEFEG